MSLLDVHEYKKDPKSGRAVLTKVSPYLRLCAKEGPPVFLKNGKAVSEDGKLIPDERLPEWFWDEVEKCNPKELAACKFSRTRSSEKQPAKRRGRPRKLEAVESEKADDNGDNQTSR